METARPGRGTGGADEGNGQGQAQSRPGDPSAQVLARLAQLVRLLGSPIDGEALAACRALRRTLDSADLDFHDLAELIERAGPKPVAVESPRERRRPAPPMKAWQLVAMSCLHAGVELKEAELEFLRSMVDWPRQPTDRQWRWLEDIARGLGIDEVVP